MLISSIIDNLCIGRDYPFFNQTSKDRSSLPATIWHDFIASSASIYIHVPRSFSFWVILQQFSLEWKFSFSWPALSICHHILIPEFCKLEFSMKPFAFFRTSESKEDSIRKCQHLFPYRLLNDDPWSRWLPSINFVFSEVPRSH